MCRHETPETVYINVSLILLIKEHKVTAVCNTNAQINNQNTKSYTAKIEKHVFKFIGLVRQLQLYSLITDLIITMIN